MSKVSEFIDLLRSQVNRGIYVWGANGENLSAMADPAAWIRKKEARHKGGMEQNIQRDLALCDKRKAAGVDPILAFDCSGLMYWAGKQVGVFKSDLAARHIFALCRAVPKDEPHPGDFLFKGSASGISHVGMYVGDGKLIECEGRDVGVVENAYKPSKWYAAGRLGALSPDEPQPEPEPVHYEKYILTKGSVRVRTGNGTDFAPIHPTPKNAYLPYFGQAEEYPHWYKVRWQGQDGYITNNPKYVEIVEK